MTDIISGNTINVAENFSNINLDSPNMIALDVTNVCNFYCLHCLNNSVPDGHKNELTNEDIIDVAKQIAEIQPMSICLCGGETTCRSNLVEIAKILSTTIPVVSMVSNGYLLDERMVQRLKDAGVSNIQISLDGIDNFQHDTFRGRIGAFLHATQAIQNIVKAGLSVATSFVPNKLNITTVEKYFDLCHSLGVPEIRMMPFLPLGRAKTLGKQLFISDDDYTKLINKIAKYNAKLTGTKITWGDPLDHLTRMPLNNTRNMDTYSMEIRSNGDIGVSPYLPICVGNIKRHTLREYWRAGYNRIWLNEKVKNLINQIQTIYDLDKMDFDNPIIFDLVEDIQ